MAMARPETILVIGGGLGGLAFAQIMRHSPLASQYTVRVLERDETPTQRGQGYQIGINHAGLSHLSTIPSIASVLDANTKPHAVTILDGDLNLWAQLKRGPGGASGIAGLVNRWKLRTALAKGLDVEWGKRFVSYEEFDTHVVAHFDDGTEARGDLLIGADGVRSRVREQRCPELRLREIPVLSTAGSVAITPTVRETMPRVVELAESSYVNRAIAKDGNSALVMEYEAPGGESRLLWSFSFPAPSDNLDLPQDPVELKQAIDSRATVFGKELTSLIQGTSPDDYFLTRNLKAIVPVIGNPLGKTSRVTLLGDAAHAMTQHRGLGANTAFADASDLAQALARVENPWGALAEYEEKMIVRGFDAIRQSTHGTKMIHLVGVKSVIRNVVIRALGWILWARQRVWS